MIDEKFALLRTHRNNIDRYRRLLRTKLTDLERQFVEKRLSEEQTAMDELAAATFPVVFKKPASAIAVPTSAAGEAGHA